MPPDSPGKSLAAFDGRCILDPPQRGCRVGDPGAGCVAPRSNIPDILGRRALPSRRLARLGATPDFHHGLLSAVLILLFASGGRAAAPALHDTFDAKKAFAYTSQIVAFGERWPGSPGHLKTQALIKQVLTRDG